MSVVPISQCRPHGITNSTLDSVRRIRPVLDRSFPLEGLADAFRHQESNRHFGKIVCEY